MTGELGIGLAMGIVGAAAGYCLGISSALARRLRPDYDVELERRRIFADTAGRFVELRSLAIERVPELGGRTLAGDPADLGSEAAMHVHRLRGVLEILERIDQTQTPEWWLGVWNGPLRTAGSKLAICAPGLTRQNVDGGNA